MAVLFKYTETYLPVTGESQCMVLVSPAPKLLVTCEQGMNVRGSKFSVLNGSLFPTPIVRFDSLLAGNGKDTKICMYLLYPLQFTKNCKIYLEFKKHKKTKWASYRIDHFHVSLFSLAW